MNNELMEALRALLNSMAEDEIEEEEEEDLEEEFEEEAPAEADPMQVTAGIVTSLLSQYMVDPISYEDLVANHRHENVTLVCNGEEEALAYQRGEINPLAFDIPDELAKTVGEQLIEIGKRLVSATN